VLGLVACRRTHFARCARYVQTGGDKSEHEARSRARPQALRSSAAHSRPSAAPPSGLEHWYLAECRMRPLLPARRRVGPGWGELAPPRSTGILAARASAVRALTRRGCLSAMSKANAASSATGPGSPSIAGHPRAARASRLSPSQAPPGVLPAPTRQQTPNQLAVAPLSFTTLPRRGTSALIRAANSAGGMPEMSRPSSFRRLATSGIFRILPISV
jgi:hypothetical protein